jgi:hypothetical protein
MCRGNNQAKAKVSTNTDTWSGQEIDTGICLGKRNSNFEKTVKGANMRKRINRPE